MSKIILDFGSANTHKNDIKYLTRMFDELFEVDTGKHEIIIKHQLFESAGNNIPLNPDVFDFAYEYAKVNGYETTSSVFDINSLKFLLDYDIPFVKIANNRRLDKIIGEIPRKIPVYISVGNKNQYTDILENQELKVDIILACVSKYPTDINCYIKNFDLYDLKNAISDHTTNFNLFETYEPDIIEWHYKLEDSTGLDSGDFARTPKQLKEVL